ncbi:sugar-binding protein [Paenibacillus prosopidis]|uniref:Ribose transport system substrate-binding protein n=1 Tax=Paenibacillus prosopidis TaxID=630520 RepID=A0A368VX25_9BACL|nr:sugar-binding protein [Paenibacillus prosopidis]RCW46492.1 ribose transport system substrate-binding protein [Paenibacillus prosopidis]
MSNRKWNIGIIVLFIIFACLLLSFLFSTMRIRGLLQPILSDSVSPGSSLHVVLISQELDNPYWRSIEQGAREASREYGMQLEYVGPFRINPNEQIKLLEKAIAAKADAVLLQGINDPRYRALIDKAVGIGIPVITVDTDEPDTRRLTYVGTDNLEAGKLMGELVAKAAGNGGSIAVLLGNELAPNQQLRLSGFRSVIQRHPNLSIVDVRSSNISRLQAAGVAEDILINSPKVRFMVGFSALDGIGALEASERVRPQELNIFAFDDLDETIEGIREGKIESTIIQQPYEIGFDAVSQLNDYLNGKTLPKQHFTAATVLDRSKISTGSEDNNR